MIAAALCVAAVVPLAPGLSRAQEKAPRMDAARPSAGGFYAGDPQAREKERLEEVFGIHLTIPPRRHASERVEIDDTSVTISVWQPSSGQSDIALQTRAVQWFLLGRTQFSTGSRGLFSEWPDVQSATLVFHDVLRKDQKGRRLAAETVVPYLRVKLTRARFERLKLKAVEACVEKDDCAAVFKAAFDEARFDRKGLKR